MKKGKWLLVAGLVIMMMAVGCKKMGEVEVASTPSDPTVLPLYVQGAGAYQIGHVLVWDDAINLYVQYKLDALPADGAKWQLYRCQTAVALDPLGFPYSGGIIDGWAFPYSDYPGAPYLECMLTIPVGAWTPGTIVDIAANCFVDRYPDPSSPGFQRLSAWAYYPANPFTDPDGANHGWWFPYQFGPDGEFTPGTAWGGHAMPEWNMWEFPGKNWALYLEYHPLSQTSYVGDLYLGNPKNDPQSHVVGTVTISDNVSGGSGNIVVTYATLPGYSIYDGHTEAKGALADIPQANGNPIPGQFDYYFGPFNPTVTSVSVTIPYDSDWGNNVYIGAHAIVGY